MGSGLFFPINAIFYSVLLCILFFGRKHLNTTETKIYGMLIIANLIGLIVEFSCTPAAFLYERFPFFSVLILKGYLVFILAWCVLFTIYVFTISHKKDYMLKIKEKAKLLLTLLFWISVALIFILPIELVMEQENTVRYTTGASVNFVYAISIVLILVMIYCMAKNFKNLKNKKYLPLFVFLLIGMGATYVQMTYPGFLLMTSVETYIICLMYFTIENPDVKLIAQLKEAREVADQSNYEKSMFAYNALQKLKIPMNRLNELIHRSKSETNFTQIQLNLDQMIEQTGMVDRLIHQMSGVSNISSDKLKVINRNYNLSSFLHYLETKYQNKMKQNVVFKLTIPNKLPHMLQGDSVRLKQVIGSILNNAIRFTKEGSIELKVTASIHSDICRLEFLIIDTGIGMTLEEVHSLLRLPKDKKITAEDFEQNDVEMYLVKKIVDYIGGTLVVKSERDKGTEVRIVIDQKIAEDPNGFEYSNYDQEEKKVLLIQSDADSFKDKMSKMLEERNISIVYEQYGVNGIKRLRNQEKFDVIIIDENIKKVSCSTIVDKLIREVDYKGILVVMGEKEEIKDTSVIHWKSNLKWREMVKEILKLLETKDEK